MFSRYILAFHYTYFFISFKLGRIITRIYLSILFVLTFYLTVHISSYVKLNNNCILLIYFLKHANDSMVFFEVKSISRL